MTDPRPDPASRTPSDVGAGIERGIAASVLALVEGSVADVDRRLRELDREWDVERVLAAHAATLSLTGLALGLLGRRRWLLLPVAAQTLWARHLARGESAPFRLLRRCGARTREEIDRERRALEALRRELGGAPGAATDPAERARRALAAARTR